MVWNDDHAFRIPNLGMSAQFPFRNRNGCRASYVVLHDPVQVYPTILSGLDSLAAGMLRENLFRYRHSHVGSPQQLNKRHGDLPRSAPNSLLPVPVRAQYDI